MNCGYHRQLLQLYLDEELSYQQIKHMESHLLACTSCRRELKTLRVIQVAFQQTEQVVEPSHLSQRIMQRVAITPQIQQEQPFELFRPSISEILTVILLATVSMLGVLISVPSLTASLALPPVLFQIGNFFASLNPSTISALLWVGGGAVGIWITSVWAGKELSKTEWFRSVRQRIPNLS